jgi:hypothetical protein
MTVIKKLIFKRQFWDNNIIFFSFICSKIQPYTKLINAFKNEFNFQNFNHRCCR